MKPTALGLTSSLRVCISSRSSNPSSFTSKWVSQGTAVKPPKKRAGRRSMRGLEVARAVVHEDGVALVENGRASVADLPEGEVEVAIVVDVDEVPAIPAPVLGAVGRLVLEHGAGGAVVTVDGEDAVAVAVVDHEVLLDVGAAAALDPQVDIAVTVDVARGGWCLNIRGPHALARCADAELLSLPAQPIRPRKLPAARSGFYEAPVPILCLALKVPPALGFHDLDLLIPSTRVATNVDQETDSFGGSDHPLGRGIDVLPPSVFTP